MLRKEPDDLTKGEQRLIQHDKRADVSGELQDIQERKKYAFRFFLLGFLWMTMITVILLLQGFEHIFGMHFKLGDSILLAAIGSTTVSILGILYVVANYLFPKR